MTYLSNPPARQQAMLQQIGAPSVADLYAQIPAELQLQRPLELPPGLSELALEQEIRRHAAHSAGVAKRTCFLGGGAYDHFIPSVVDEVTGRGEFYTAYTPYQAEASQGTLQAFFEYQSLMCTLTGMDASNASLYEGGTSVAEAVLMAHRVTGRSGRVVVAGSVHPEYRDVLRTYLEPLGTELVIVPATAGVVDPGQVESLVTEETSCVVVQHPNFFGCLEDVAALADAAHKQGALCVQSFDPISLGVLRKPADYGVDIAVAEGQSLGIPLQFGGPYLGILTCREDFMRKMPGRLIGSTVDRLGRPCFSLTLQAREQHIRRDKATSNICTNQGLMALRAAVYLSTLGASGLTEVAELCLQKAHYASERFRAIPGVELPFAAPFFREFTVRIAADCGPRLARAREIGYDVGPRFDRFPALFGGDITPQATRETLFLVAVTEQRTRAEIDQLADALR